MIQHGEAPFLECSSAGDYRFSAFFARVGIHTIEEIYQSAKVLEDGSTNNHWKFAKGKKAINEKEVRRAYSMLWDRYIEQNPDLGGILLKYNGLSNKFGQPGHVCQATELWRIRANLLREKTFEWS